MLVRRAEMLPIECIVRGYLSGSAWKEYQAHGHRARPAPCPPACSSPTGCPSRSSPRRPRPRSGSTTRTSPSSRRSTWSARDVADEAAAISLAAYRRAAADAAERGIVIADTKFELGWIDGKLAICDEVLTPDSSRFWEAADWRPGTTPPSFDKQPVRDWLEATGWDKTPPPPALPADVVAATARPLRRRLRAPHRDVARRLARGVGEPGDGVSAFSVLVEVTPAARRRRPPGRHHRAVAARPRLRRGRRRAGGQGHPLHGRGGRRGRGPGPGRGAVPALPHQPGDRGRHHHLSSRHADGP